MAVAELKNVVISGGPTDTLCQPTIVTSLQTIICSSVVYGNLAGGASFCGQTHLTVASFTDITGDSVVPVIASTGSVGQPSNPPGIILRYGVTGNSASFLPTSTGSNPVRLVRVEWSDGSSKDFTVVLPEAYYSVTSYAGDIGTVAIVKANDCDAFPAGTDPYGGERPISTISYIVDPNITGKHVHIAKSHYSKHITDGTDWSSISGAASVLNVTNAIGATPNDILADIHTAHPNVTIANANWIKYTSNASSAGLPTSAQLFPSGSDYLELNAGPGERTGVMQRFGMPLGNSQFAPYLQRLCRDGIERIQMFLNTNYGNFPAGATLKMHLFSNYSNHTITHDISTVGNSGGTAKYFTPDFTPTTLDDNWPIMIIELDNTLGASSANTNIERIYTQPTSQQRPISGVISRAVTKPDISYLNADRNALKTAAGIPSTLPSKIPGSTGSQHYECLNIFYENTFVGAAPADSASTAIGAQSDFNTVYGLIKNQSGIHADKGAYIPFTHVHHYSEHIHQCPGPIEVCNDSSNINYWQYTDEQCDGTAVSFSPGLPFPLSLIMTLDLIGPTNSMSAVLYPDQTVNCLDCDCGDFHISNQSTVTTIVNDHSCTYGELIIDLSAAINSTGPIQVFIVPNSASTINAGVTHTSSTNNDTVAYGIFTPDTNGQIIIDENTSYIANTTMSAVELTLINSSSPTTQDNTTVNYTGTPGLPPDQGSYSIYMIDEDGCFYANKFGISFDQPLYPILTLTATSTAIICHSDSNGTATVTAAGGSGTYTYLWSNGQTIPAATGFPASTPSVVVTDTITGCQEYLAIVVPGIANISTFLQATHVTCYNNGSIQALMGGGTGIYTWLWSTGATTNMISGLVPGTYTCQATDSNGCVGYLETKILLDNGIYGCTDPMACNYDATANCDDGSCILPDGCTDPLAVNYNASALCDDGSCYYCSTVLSATASDVRCNGENNGIITINSVTGGSVPYSYLWSTGSTSSTGITGLSPGTYTLDILDNNNCLLTTSWTITEPSIVTMIPTLVVDNTDCLVANGSITPTPAGGVAPYTFSWSASSGGVVPAGQSTNQNLTGLIAGTYSLIITDVNSCVNSPIPAIVSDGFVNGCIDPLACNYDALATCDDGSCTYVTQPDPTLTFVDTTCEVSLVANWGAGIPCAQVDRVEIWLDMDNTPGGDTLIMTIFQAQLGNSFVQDLGTDDCAGQGFTAAITPFLPTTPVLYMQIHYINTTTVTTTGPFGHNAGAPALISSTNNAPVNCGCTDPIATNYNAAATCDCCCVYGNTGCTDDGTFVNQGQTWWTDPASNTTGIAYDVITGIANYPGAQPANYCPTCTTDDGSCLYPPGPSCCTTPDAHFTTNSLITPCLVYYGSYLSCGWSPTVTLIAQVHHVQFWNGSAWVTTNSVVVASPSINSYIHWQYACNTPLTPVDDFQNGGLDGTYRVVIVTTDSNGLICTAEGDGIYIDFPECGCTDPLGTNYCATCTCSLNTCTYPDPCTWNATLTPEVCNSSGATVTVAGGTPPFTFVWEDLTNPGIPIPWPYQTTNATFTSSDLNKWVGNTPFDYNGTCQFVCHITDSFGCTETVGVYQPVYSPQIVSLLVHVVTGDIMYCPPASPPPTGGSYQLYPGTTIPAITILSTVVTGPNSYSSTLLADTNLAAGGYTAICVMSNGCTFSRGFTIYNDPQLSGCTDPTACNYNAMAACDDGTCWYLDVVSTDIDCTGVGSVTVDLITPGFVSGPNYTFYLTAPTGGQFGHILGAPITWPHTYSTLTQVGAHTVGVYGDGLSGVCTVPFTIADNNVHGCMDVTASNTNEDCLGNTVVPTCDDCCDYCFTTVNDVITCLDTSIAQDGEILLTVAMGTAPYSFLWSNGATTQNISNLTVAGTYTCVITDSTGCIVTYTGIIIDCTPYILPTIISTIATDVPCLVDMNILTSGGDAVGPDDFYFIDSGGTPVAGNFTTGIGITNPNVYNTNFAVACGGGFNDSITNYAAWNLIPGQVYTSALNYTLPNGVTGTVYGPPMTVPLNANMVCGCMDATADNFNEDCATGLTVVPTCDICCDFCSATLTVAAVASACGLGTILIATVLNCGGCLGVYAWTGSLNGAVSSNLGSIIIPTGGGSVTCTWTENITGCVYTDTLTFPAPPTSVTLGQTNTCANNLPIDNGTITQTVAPGTPPYTYAWTAASGGVVPGAQTTNQNLTGLVPGDYNCVVIDASGCTGTATSTITACCVTGCTDNSTYAFNYDVTNICTCNSGSANDCCVYPVTTALISQTVTGCNNTIILSTSDTNASALADTASATFQIISDPAGAATLIALPLPLSSTGTDTYGLTFIEDCSTFFFPLNGDYAIQYVITYANGHTETIQSNTVTYVRRICGCMDAAAINYDATATCPDTCIYSGSITCALALNITSAGCIDDLVLTASDSSSNIVASWAWVIEDATTNTTMASGSSSMTSLAATSNGVDACGTPVVAYAMNTTYDATVTVTFTNGTTDTCTTSVITTPTYICGCTDANATNYNAAATCDDGSCTYPCCSLPTFTATANNNPGGCTLEYLSTLTCAVSEYAETIVSTLQFWDGTTWQISDVLTETTTAAANATAGVSNTYNYSCTTNTFGTYGTGDYRVVFDITYVGGATCQLISATDTLTFNPCGCTDPTATNYDPLAICDDGTCISSSCCTPDTIGLDPSSTTVNTCTPDLLFTATCSPITVSHVINWYMWDTAGTAWVLLTTATVVSANTSINEILPFANLHTTPGSEIYKAEAVITYAGSTCTIELQYTYTPTGPLGCTDLTPGLYPDVNGYDASAVYDCTTSTTIPTAGNIMSYPTIGGYLNSNVDQCAVCPGPCTPGNPIHTWRDCNTLVEYTFVEMGATGAGSESNDYYIAVGSPSPGNTIQYLNDCYEYVGISVTNTLGTIINYSSANFLLLPFYFNCIDCSAVFHEWKMCVCPSSWVPAIVWADCAEDIVNMIGDPTSVYPLANTALNNGIFYNYVVAQNGAPIVIGDVLNIRHTSGVGSYCIEYMGPSPYNAATHHGYTTMLGEYELGNNHTLVGPADVYADCTLCASAPPLYMEWEKCGTTDLYNIVDVGVAVTSANTITWVGTNQSGAIQMPGYPAANLTWGPIIGATVIKLSNGDCFKFNGYNVAPAGNATSELIDASPTIPLELDCTSCLLVPGCTDPSADNYNENCATLPVLATISDGCCQYTLTGCMDTGALTQNYWDGLEPYNGINSQSPNDYATILTTVTYPGILPINPNPTATSDDGSCIYEGCTDPAANNYVTYASVDDGSCNYCVYGCTNPAFVQYNSLATCDCNSSDPAQGNTGPLDPLLDNDCCVDLCVSGCMDCGTIWETDSVANPGAITCLTQTGTAASGAGSTNFDPLATCPAGCITPLNGCTSATALNYDPTANNDDGSCLYCSGFTTAMGPALSGTGQAFVIDAASVNTATNWFQASLATTIEDPTGSFTGSAILTMGINPNVQLPAVLYITIFDSTGNIVMSGPSSSAPGVIFSAVGLSYGSYSIVISTISLPVWSVAQVCDNTFTFDIQTPACDDPAAFNTTLIPAQYVISDPTLCIVPGFCACAVTATTVVSSLCGVPSSIVWNMTCNPGQSITGYLEQSLDNGATWTTIVASITGTSNGFNTLLHTQLVTTNSQWRFTYTETTTPSCGTAGTVVMSPIIITTMPLCGCTDVTAQNYDPLAVLDDGSCIYCIYGCIDPLASNYNIAATCDDGSCLYAIEGCTDPGASNYSSGATIDDGSCIYCDAEYWDCIPQANTSTNSCTGTAVTLLISEGILLSTNTYDSTELDPWTTFPNQDMALTALVLIHGITANFNDYYYQSAQPCGAYPAGCCLNGFVKKKITSITHVGMPGQFFNTWKTYIDAAILAGVPTGSLILPANSDGCHPATGYNVSIESSTVSNTPSTANIISGALGSPSENSDTINIIACCTGSCNCSEVAVEGPNTSQAACLSDPFCCLTPQSL